VYELSTNTNSTQEESDAYENYVLEAEAEALAEAQAACPVHRRLRRIAFTSFSKGRGRKRKAGIEVDLVVELISGHARLWENYPWDVYASEILPYASPDVSVPLLQETLASNARKGWR